MKEQNLVSGRWLSEDRKEPTGRLFASNYAQNMNAGLLIKERHSDRNIVAISVFQHLLPSKYYYHVD